MTENPGLLAITSLDCRRIRLDFRMNVAHSLASRTFSESIIVTIKSASGVTGYGEGVPRTYVTGETTAGAHVFAETLLSDLRDRTFSVPHEVITYLERVGSIAPGNLNPAAFCAVELALLDCAGKHWALPVAEMIGLGMSEEPLRYSLVVPLLEDMLEAFLLHAAAFDFQQVKVKVDSHDPGSRVRWVRKFLGETVEIRIDANCSWNRKNAREYTHEMSDLGVVSIEQPLVADDLAGSAELRREGLIPIILDESVCSTDDVERIAACGAADVINVRVSKCGGLTGSRRVIKTALRHGLNVQLGAQVGESSILTAAGSHLAAGTPAFRWLEGCFGGHLIMTDVCDEPLQFGAGGLFSPPAGNGLGVEVNGMLVKETTVPGTD